ncbi:ADP-glyceromanno-heptose 6-epimerase [Engelhardtia mirabilis]|uniref:ADP-L-glycero-D-manno-heptose-6-epimerase n=1 Tax=Engelhardtia mirabilis TaxID=2528011 RepID=A0A518BQT0_9BACT|nr:ADP-L-glycero-D-manno-heptose-6-epimerase [Planctomycetes bacterium Pla133]QDV03626.1 ADP-L-glycero-D-manno-heptose-6-epimerase [Planctomycetes bacterium Pla86]
MILITGGAGFIGSNLVAALCDRGEHELVIVDRLRDGEKWRNIAKRELADVVRPEDLPFFLERNRGRVEAIFHMGAISATTERDADKIVANNLRLTLDLWEWCARNGARMIYASSAATYGDGALGFDDDGSISALAKLRPLNAYGWSKLAVDRRAARLVAEGAPSPPQWAGLKFFNVYGPNEGHKGDMKSVVAKTYPRAAAGEPAVLFRSHNPDYEDGGQLRDFVWVGDCVEMMLWLYDHPEVSGLFNCGSGKARSFVDLTRAVFTALGREPLIEFVDTPVEIRDKYQYFTEAKMDRIRAAGFSAPSTTLEDGIAEYVQSYLHTDDPYR